MPFRGHARTVKDFDRPFQMTAQINRAIKQQTPCSPSKKSRSYPTVLLSELREFDFVRDLLGIDWMEGEISTNFSRHAPIF